MEKIIYKEDQRFGSPGLYVSMGVIYIGTMIFFLYAMYSQFILKEPIGSEPMSDLGLIITTVLILLVFLLSGYFLFGSKLVVTITATNLSLTFKPLLKKPLSYTAADIERWEVRKYKPIKEYGGWGVKFGTKGVGRAYNVRGSIGLQLYLNNNKKVLIGTERGDAIGRAIKKMMESKTDG